MITSMNYKNIGPLIINIDGIKLSDSEKGLIKNKLIGGIILFSHNYVSRTQLESLILDIKSIKDNLLVSIDHEGGRVQRIIDQFTHLPSFTSISNIKDTDKKLTESYNAGFVGASELSEISIDVNYSPVIDIFHDKNNILLEDRTFGSDPNEIILLADTYIKGCLDGGILPVLKHFPGHGRVKADSHTEDCVSNIDLDTLMKTDILPFKILHKKYSKNNLPIMTNHIIYPKVDEIITTYSKQWLTNVSSSIFDTRPFFISDDIEMHAAKKVDGKNISCEERILRALNAGCRMIIITTMQNREIIANNESYKYFEKNCFTKNIIEHYEKNHDKMDDVILPR